MSCCKPGEWCLVDGKLARRAPVEREITLLAIARIGFGTVREGIIVRWLGVNWRGVPMPLRWLLRCRVKLPSRLPGCGCVDSIKTLWERFAAWCRYT